MHNEYIARINKTIDYIEQNLKNQFTLDELARISLFSKFHFNRLFSSLVGEPPFKFIQRVRVERAASLIKMQAHLSISQVAYECGYSDISIFSRNFKAHFKKTPTDFKNSNISQVKSKESQLKHIPTSYFCHSSNTIKWKTTMELNKSVEIQELPTITVAYIRHVGPYQGNVNLFEQLWNKLFTWAGPRGLIGGADFRSLIMYHDDPNITDNEKLRLSVCVSVADDTKVDGEVGKMIIEGGKYMVARFEVTPKDFQTAWEWVYSQWLPQSGYQPDDKPCFEMYPEAPKGETMIVDICVPIKAL